jgi:hypothetical protein
MSHSPGYLPPREADFLAWSTNFNDLISLSPESYGLTAAQATNYATLHTTFANAYAVAHGSNRGPVATQTKNTAKRALIADARGLVRIIQAFPGTTDTMRVQLQVNVPDEEPTPIPPPSTAPILSIVRTVNRVVTVRLRDSEDTDRRGKPHGVSGASIFVFIGETPPADPLQWSFLLNTSLTDLDIPFASTVPGGSTVWLAAFWFNPRKQSGPASTAVSTVIADGMAKKLAA